MPKKADIRSLDRVELKKEIEALGEKGFRADQIYDWLWKKNVGSFDEMLNLGKALRNKLKEHFEFAKISVQSRLKSSDGTVKFSFLLAGGQLVEGVLIPADNRVTACISSQAGCSLSCAFCATGRLVLKHNLHFYEIFDQVAFFKEESQKEYGISLTNIVYMGMGEPLLNYRNVLKSVERICAEDGLGMSPKRITISTAGIAKMIKKLGDDEVKFEFALSLHAANDQKRSEIMAINETNTLAVLAEALKHLYEKTHKRITLEYIVFKDINDSIEDAKELLNFSRVVPTKINIIEYNPIEGSHFEQTTEKRLTDFVNYLEKRGAIVNIRRSRGKDVNGACGQLALKSGT